MNPGLSAYAEDPNVAGVSWSELVEFAKPRIPKGMWMDSDIRLMATAGMRLLDFPVHERLLEVTHFRPIICYRPVNRSDLERLEQIHRDIFPIRYESEFFQSVVSGCDIVSWAAVDRSRPDGHGDELIGFVTAKIVLARESEISDLIRYDSTKGEETLVYILTLGVVETYRNLGIASLLINEVIKYASGIPTCRGVYLHVIAHNNPAIRLYKRMSFRCVRRLHGFYLINGQHFDAYLFVYFINGARSPCSPLEVVMMVLNYMRSGIRSVASKLTKNEEKGLKWIKCKDTRCLLPTQTKRNLASERSSTYECV